MAELKNVIDHLAQHPYQDHQLWRGWDITPITGGMNNLLYRVCRAEEDYAIKFTVRDWRHRARREYNALKLLTAKSLYIAPKAILLDEESYEHAVTVQTWLEGAVLADAPANDLEWQHLLGHYAQIHQITPHPSITTIEEGVVPVNNIKLAIDRMNEARSRLPDDLRPDAIKAIDARFELLKFIEWEETTPKRLCRFDPNTLNFVRQPNQWFSVDWENSGWGDATFEIGDLLAHPKYRFVEQSRIDWAIQQYCQMTHVPNNIRRIRIYYLLTVMWWVHGFASHAFKIIAYTDNRLVQRPAGWREDMLEKYHYYVELANSLLDKDWIS